MKKLLAWPIFLGIQAITSIALLFFIYRLGIMPMKYLAIIFVVLALLCLFTFFLMKPKGNKETARNLIGKIISILLSILMIVGNNYVIRGGNAISNFTNATTQTNSISAIVLKNSSATTINDLEGKTFGINSSTDEDNLNATIKELENNIGTITTKDYKDFESLAEALYSENVDVILMDEAYRTIVEDKYETFTDEDTRVIWQYQYETQMDDFSKNVDVTSKPFTIYLSGIDTTGKVSTVSRSDVNMLVTVNPKTKQILMTSIPRDYYVTLANKGKKDKLTHAGIFGVKNSVETIENFMGIEINYYAKVNFTSLITIVDALGGVEVYSDKTLTNLWTDHSVTIQKGYNLMDGKTALAFARERHSYANGDNHRVQNQQEVLKGIIKKVTSSKIITNYNDILSAIEGSFETNMTSKEITSLIQMQINDMASWDIQQTQLTGTGKSMYGGALMPSSKLYYMIPNDESIATCKAYIEKMMNGETINISE